MKEMLQFILMLEMMRMVMASIRIVMKWIVKLQVMEVRIL
jgi:hypothetical protein